MKKKSIKIVLNAPAVLIFCGVCIFSLILNYMTNGVTNTLLFSVYRASLLDPLTYTRFFLHTCGHASVSHLIGNLMYILLLGPILEEKYGSRAIIAVIFVTALVTGVIHFIFFPNVALLGASGVVFAMILLTASVGFREREIPLTFILVAVLYIGNEIINGIFLSDNISQLTHIAGGIVGALLGYRWRKK